MSVDLNFSDEMYFSYSFGSNKVSAKFQFSTDLTVFVATPMQPRPGH